MPDDTDEFQDISSDVEILIEYLDGELPQRDRRIVEQRLAEESGLRETLARLEESWHYLDLLERVGTDKDLVETTLETVVVSEEESMTALQQRRKRRFPWKVSLLTVLFLLLFLISFHFGERLAPDDNFLIRVASPIIERLDMYLMLLDDDPDLEMLRLLAERRTFLPPLPAGTPPVPAKEFLPSSTANILESFTIHPTFSELRRRVERIENLDETLYNQFYWNNKRFQALGREKKFRLKTLHENIEQSPRRYELYQTLLNYYTWFKSLQSYEKTELRQGNLTTGERVEKIASLKKHLEQDRVTTYAAPTVSEILTSDANVEKLADILRNLDARRLEDALNASPDQTINHLMRLFSENSPNDPQKSSQSH